MGINKTNRKKTVWELATVGRIMAAIGTGYNTRRSMAIIPHKYETVKRGRIPDPTLTMDLVAMGTVNKYFNENKGESLVKQGLARIITSGKINRHNGEVYAYEVVYDKLVAQIVAAYNIEVEGLTILINSTINKLQTRWDEYTRAIMVLEPKVKELMKKRRKEIKAKYGNNPNYLYAKIPPRKEVIPETGEEVESGEEEEIRLETIDDILFSKPPKEYLILKRFEMSRKLITRHKDWLREFVKIYESGKLQIEELSQDDRDLLIRALKTQFEWEIISGKQHSINHMIIHILEELKIGRFYTAPYHPPKSQVGISNDFYQFYPKDTSPWTSNLNTPGILKMNEVLRTTPRIMGLEGYEAAKAGG